MNSSFRTAFWALCCGLTIPMMLFVGVELLSGGPQSPRNSARAKDLPRNLRDQLHDSTGQPPESRQIAKARPSRALATKPGARPQSPSRDVPAPRTHQPPAVELLPELAADDPGQTPDEAPPAPQKTNGAVDHPGRVPEIAGNFSGSGEVSAGVILGPQLEVDNSPAEKQGADKRVSATPTHATPKPQSDPESEPAATLASGSVIEARLSSIQHDVELIAQTISAQAASVPADPFRHATQLLEQLEQARRLQKVVENEPAVDPMSARADDDDSKSGPSLPGDEAVHPRESSHAKSSPASPAMRIAAKIYRPRHVSAAALKALVVPLLTDGTGKVGASGIAADEPETSETSAATSNVPEALVVSDTAEVLKRIDRLVQEVDIAPAQIFLEATVLSVRLHPTRPTGINLVEFNSSSQPFAVSSDGNLPGTTNVSDRGHIPAGVLLTHGAGVKCGVLHGNPRAFIHALQASHSAENSAAWQLTLVNKQSADLLIPAGAIGTASSGTVLRLRPMVTRDGVVHLEVRPEANPSAAWDGRSRTPLNRFLLRDGDSAIVAGLTEEHLVAHSFRDGPLGDLPFMGRMFRKQVEIPQRTEVIVLLTPHIVPPESESLSIPANGPQRTPAGDPRASRH